MILGGNGRRTFRQACYDGSRAGLFTTKPTAYYDPPHKVTVDATNGVSTLPDLFSTNDATQGTAANRPVLSGGDARENTTVNSSTLTLWAATGLTSFLAVADADGGTAAVRVLEDTSNGAHSINNNALAQTTMYAGVDYKVSVRFKSTTRNAAFYLYDTGFSAGAYANTTTGAISSAVSSGCTITGAVITDAGSGWWLYTANVNLTTTKTSIAWNLGNYTTTESYIGDASKSVDYYAPHTRLASTSAAYIPTTTYPIYQSLNGNVCPVYDGVNDSLSTTLAVNPTGGMSGACVVKLNALPASQAIIYGAEPTAGASGLYFLINSQGRLYVNIFKNSTDFIGRRGTTGDIAINTPYVLSWTYSGGTTSAAIKTYINGVLKDVADSAGGAYTVPGAGANLFLGASTAAANFLNGYLGSAVYKQGGYWSAEEHLNIVNSLMDRYGI